MNCARCNGYVVPEQISDPHGTTERFEAVRCLNCGNIQDAMIEANRNHHMVCRLSSRVPRTPVAGSSLDRWFDYAWEASRES
jgi:ribosomal protein S27E